MFSPRTLPHVDPHAPRGALRSALVAMASSRLVGRLSKTAPWRKTVWKLGPLLLRLSGGRIGTALGVPTALLETRGARTGHGNATRSSTSTTATE